MLIILGQNFITIANNKCSRVDSASCFILSKLFLFFIISLVLASANEQEESIATKYWKNHAAQKIRNYLDRKTSYGDDAKKTQEETEILFKRAKNVILFVGDGMGPTVVTSARIYKSQKQKPMDSFKNEHYQKPFTFETFPYSAFVKTHSANTHVTDSASAACSLLCGAKFPIDSVSIFWSTLENSSSSSSNSNSSSSSNSSHQAENKTGDILLDCIAAHAILAGKKVGLVTTTRITHATPAALYAHTPYRMAEAIDAKSKMEPNKTYEDIAYQMLNDWPGSNFTVILGGGASYFKPCPNGSRLPANFNPETDAHEVSCRLDSSYLIYDWLMKTNENNNATTNNGDLLVNTTTNTKSNKRIFTQNFDDLSSKFESENFTDVEQVLGLFAENHLNYVLNRKTGENLQANNPQIQQRQPTLPQMAEFALKMLAAKSQENGYFLLIEGGRIDSALHVNQAKKSFEEMLEFDEAIQKVIDLIDLDETLVIVTADHSHNLNLIGYAPKTVPILSYLPQPDGEPILESHNNWTMLMFIDGPSTIANQTARFKDPESKDFRQPILVKRKSASHGGEDVPAYAIGPWSPLFTGLLENTDIFYFMCYAMRLNSCGISPLLSKGVINSQSPDKVVPNINRKLGVVVKDVSTMVDLHGSHNLYFPATVIVTLFLIVSIILNAVLVFRS